MDGKQRRTCLIQVRLTPEEMARVKALMELSGYTVYSCFLRELILQKRLPYRQEIEHVSPRQLSDKINVLI